MGDVTIIPQAAKATGVVATFTTLNSSDDFKIANTGQLFLYVKETAASTPTLTIDTPLIVGGLAVSNQAIAFAANDEKIIGPFPPHLYGDTLSITSSSGNLDLAAAHL